jgi:hypothetical protein
MRRALLLVPLAALAVACGGGGGGDRLSREELQSRVNAICAKIDRRLQALGEPESIDEVAEFARKATRLAQDGVAELRALEPPEDDERQYDRFLAEGDRVVALSRRLERAAREADSEALEQILQEARDSEERSDRVARNLGFDECAEN